jgi:TonB family protein
MKNTLRVTTLFLSLTILSSCFTSDKVNKTSPNQELPFELNLTDPHTILMMAEKQPEFPGGENARIKFLTENIIYPEKSRINRISGTVFSCFVVEKDGTISEIRILKGVNEEMDNEVIRVIKLMPKWKPGIQDGEPVRVLYSMPIRFCL